MEFYITSVSREIDLEDLRKILEERIDSNGITLEIRKLEFILRGLDPTVLVAIVSALGTGLGALITGLLQIARQSTNKKIVMQSQSGQRLEVPADISPEELDALLEKLKELETQKVKVVVP